MTHSLYCLFAVVLFATPAFAQSGSPREFAMGGTAVASADYLSAGFSNPALLTHYSDADDDDWGLMLPNVYVFASDRNNLLDSIDSFTQSFETLEDGLGGLTTQEDLDNLAASLDALSDKHFIAGGGFGLALAIPSTSFSAAVVASTFVEADVFMNIDPDDRDRIEDAVLDIPSLGSEAVLLGSFRTEIGLAMAREFEFSGRTVSLGITPKIQNLEILDLVVNAELSDDLEDQIDSDNRFTDDNINFDLGASTMISENLRVGLAARNLMGGTFAGLSGLYNYKLDPALTTGIAYTSGPLTLAADLDLTTTTRFQEIDSDDSQFLRLGAELKSQWAQLRAGYILDLEDNYSNMATAGIGFSPFGGMHLDLAGAVGENSYGGSLALSFTF
ncbi:MAG: conjugal transfer protein TraF [Planctomycetes bacterium]|nr:conjugal transfer protein TraF [Planctomycetota bacterium]